MTIKRTSRYYDGPLAQLKNEKKNIYEIAVYRKFPESINTNFVEHTYVEGETLSQIAAQYNNYGTATYWWKIMEINPEITDPFNIEPGTVIRVPNV